MFAQYEIDTGLVTRLCGDHEEVPAGCTVMELDETEQALALSAPRLRVVGGELAIDPDWLRENLRAAVKARRDQAEWGGVAVPVDDANRVVIDTNPDSQRKISGGALDAFIALTLGEAWNEVWRMADDTELPISATQMVGIGRLVKAHVSSCQQNKNALDALINAATTLAELEAIDIETGWPS